MRQIVERHRYIIKNYDNKDHICYVLQDIYIRLNSDYIIFQVSAVDIEKATLFDPPVKLALAWLRGAQEASEKKKIKKSDNKDTQRSQPIATSNIHIQNPSVQLNFAYGYGQSMYPPRMELLMSDYGPPLSFHSTFSHTALLNNDILFNTAVSVFSSPASVGSDLIKRLESYVKWHIK